MICKPDQTIKRSIFPLITFRFLLGLPVLFLGYQMKRFALLILIFLVSCQAQSQGLIRTIVPGAAVISGESFRVQYYIEDASGINSVTTPDFSPFRLVTGPDVYTGNKFGQAKFTTAKNYVFTLEAPAPGTYSIPGAIFSYNGEFFKCPDEKVEVLSKDIALQTAAAEATMQAGYFLKPGEDVGLKIKENLFLQVEVDKKRVVVGEPVIVTYKLYSSLHSKSEIVKNPGFYGFTVEDLINLSDKQVTTELIKGKPFDVHTIRKSILYPLQAGSFIIDAIEITNKIAFSTDGSYRKPHQQIVEGVLHNVADDFYPTDKIIETDLHSSEIIVSVSPLPENNKPPGYSGAVGQFSVAASTRNSVLARNEQGFLDLVITGSGNFIQLEAPLIKWPATIEGYFFKNNDTENKKNTANGVKKFTYAYIATKPGKYVLPPIPFTYYNLKNKKYETIQTASIPFVIKKETVKQAAIENQPSIAEKNERKSRLAFFIVLTIVVCILAYWIFFKKESPKVNVEEQPRPPVIEDLLQPLQLVLEKENAIFYPLLNQTIWNYLNTYFKNDKNVYDKMAVSHLLKQKTIPEETIHELLSVLTECEMGTYAPAGLTSNKSDILEKSFRILGSINKVLF